MLQGVGIARDHWRTREEVEHLGVVGAPTLSAHDEVSKEPC